jgi:nitroimidazol reductase NimA-like FMN-containing flavoprotein (pyridoxamine 5'-phosphate oxidase superfamily)
VRRKEKALENPKDLEAILSQSTVCYLALKTKGAPYILPMSYGYHAGVLYFHCAPVGHKIDLLRREPEVGFHISEGVRVREGNVPCQFGVAYRSIIGTGRVSFLEERENKQKALKILMRQHTGEEEHTFLSEAVDATSVFVLHIQEMSGKQSGDHKE